MLFILSISFFIIRFFTNLYTFEFQASLFIPVVISFLSLMMFHQLGTITFKSRDSGLIAAFLFLISPWQHALVMRSTIGVLFIFLLIVTLYFFLKKQRKILLTGGVVLTGMCLAVLLFQQQTIAEIIHEQDKVIWQQIVSDNSTQSVLITRALHNKVFETNWFTLERLLTYFEPQGFFITGSYFIGKSLVGSGFLLTASFPFFIYGLLLMIRKTIHPFLLLFLLFGATPGIVSIHVQHIILGSALLIPLLLITTYGISEWIKNSLFKTVLVFFVLTLNFVFVYAQYMPILMIQSAP